MDFSDPSDTVVAPEDVVDTLIDFLVGPLLPARSSTRDNPSISLQQSVAKQMHAVVLLYNYYHRKQFPQLEFLDFESFCKVAINSKPSLLVYMKRMQLCNAQPDNYDKQISITEKAVMDACNICMGLDTSKDAPSLEEWPISKVVVFLTDTTEQNCLLQMSNITQGVWSLIEKNYDYCSNRPEVFEKKKVTKRPLEDQFSAHEARLQKVAVLAVEEKTGVAQKDILLLESHVVYSLSEEQRAACFYIMKFSKSINQDIIQVPISDAIDSLQGPLVKKSFGDCTVTPVVEYFHLLPYARIIAQWYSRKMLPDDLVSKPEAKTDMNLGFPLTNDVSCIETPVENSEKSHATNQSATIVNIMEGNYTIKVNHKENSSDCFSNFSDANHGCHSKAEAGSSIVPLLSDQKACSSENDSSVTRTCFKDKAEVIDLVRQSCNNNSTDVNTADGNHLHCNESSQDGRIVKDHSLVPSQSEPKCVDKVQAMMLPKRNELLQTFSEVLLKKRKELSHQLRHQMDELARFENYLETIFNGGDNLMLMIESVMEVCNARSTIDATESHTEKRLPLEEKCSTKCFKKRRLSEAILHLSNACQELDSICSENNWMLPQYNVFPSNGGFAANVMVRGADFECSDCGDVQANPHEGRKSAAAHVLSKLRSMANQAQ